MDVPPEWSGRANSRVLTSIALAGLAIVLFLPSMPLWVRLLEMLAVAAVVSFSSVVATVDEEGLRVGVGPVRWPRWRVATKDVEGAEAIDVKPLRYGGWGYRVKPGVRAVIIRSGQAIRVARRGASDLVVTVDDAEAGAALLNEHAGRAGGR